MDAEKVLHYWQTQLEKIVAPSLARELAHGYGFQVVLFVKPNGKVGWPKWTVTTESKHTVDNNIVAIIK